VRSGDTFDPGDLLPHAYLARAVDDGCAVSADSAPVDFTDEGDPRPPDLFCP
jgi:hypothetical protein